MLQRGKICKPYNSVLGEHFRAHWDVIPVSYPADPSDPPIQHLYVALPAPSSKSDTVSVKSAQSARLNENKTDSMKGADTLTANNSSNGVKVVNSSPTSNPQVAVGETILAAGMSNLSLSGSTYNAETGELIEGEVEGGDRVRVIYLVSMSCGTVSNDDPHRPDGEDGAGFPPPANIILLHIVSCAACDGVWRGSDISQGVWHNDPCLSWILEPGHIRKNRWRPRKRRKVPDHTSNRTGQRCLER